MSRSLRLLCAATVLAAVLVGCAAEPLRWERPDSSAADYRQDLADCEQVGLAAGLEASVTRTRPIPSAQAKGFRSCMQAKGWTAAPVSGGGDPARPELPVSRVEDNATGVFVVAFDRAFDAPPGYGYLSSTRSRTSRAVTENHLFTAPGGGYAAVTVQDGLDPDALPERYLPPDPLFVYDRSEPNDYGMAWSSFAGLSGGRWTSGFGGYCMAGEDHPRGRFAVIVSEPLPEPRDPPPPGRRLDEVQHKAMTWMTARNVRWFTANCPPPPPGWLERQLRRLP